MQKYWGEIKEKESGFPEEEHTINPVTEEDIINAEIALALIPNTCQFALQREAFRLSISDNPDSREIAHKAMYVGDWLGYFGVYVEPPNTIRECAAFCQ